MSFGPFVWKCGGKPWKLELRAPDKVCYPLALRLEHTPPQPSANPSTTSPFSLDQLVSIPSSTPAKGNDKEKELAPPTEVLKVETEEEVAEMSQLNRKKREKE